MCRTVILTNLLPNVENLPKIGPAGLDVPDTRAGGHALSRAADGRGRTCRGLASFR